LLLDVKKLGERVSTLKDSIATEEATKTSLIMPFFQLLGYDVFNPLEFSPEYVADVGIKKGEKVDYAILNNNNPIILIE
ncbi:endonuclease, partial [Listeria monocytogenes]|nr:endonuclease [Listeria monocytogenes]